MGSKTSNAMATLREIELIVKAERELREANERGVAQALDLQADKYRSELSGIHRELARLEQCIDDIDAETSRRFWLLVAIVVVGTVGITVYMSQLLFQHIAGKIP